MKICRISVAERTEQDDNSMMNEVNAGWQNRRNEEHQDINIIRALLKPLNIIGAL